MGGRQHGKDYPYVKFYELIKLTYVQTFLYMFKNCIIN